MLKDGYVVCDGCDDDIYAYSEDFEDGGQEYFCTHCIWERHVCPEGKYTKLVADAVSRIKEHESAWLATLKDEVPSYCEEESYADQGGDVNRMDEVQADQAFAAQELLRTLLKEFEGVAA
ncbi:hypothetical protein [Streptomyces sp. NPDC059928]|uniref:hypothetical protein n=1 Tax=unclassified Streptomyces TaxID=2593676 RepID=UPI0036578D80